MLAPSRVARTARHFGSSARQHPGGPVERTDGDRFVRRPGQPGASDDDGLARPWTVPGAVRRSGDVVVAGPLEVVPNHKRADGATETGRPASVGSAPQGVACSSPVGTTTTGLEPRNGRERGHEQPVEALDGPGQLGFGPGAQGSMCSPVSQATQGQPYVAELVADLCDSSHAAVAEAAFGHHDGVQFPVDIGKFDEGGATRAH